MCGAADMFRAARRTGSPVLALLLLAACAETSAPTISAVRLALTGEVLRADTLSLTVYAEGEPVEIWSSAAPHDDADALFIELAPGVYDRLQLDGRLNALPFLSGATEPFTVTAGETTDVRLIVDPVGLLEVAPVGLPLDIPIIARPLAPLADEPTEIALTRTDGVYGATLFDGRYRIDVDVPAELDLVTADVLDVDVVAGARAVLRPVFGPADLIAAPQAVERLLVDVVGGAVLTAGQTSALIVTALDPDGRQVADYGGQVTFSIIEALPVSPAVPDPYRFGPEDAGRRVFSAGIGAPDIVARLPFTLVVRDIDNDLETTVQLCVESPPLITGCPIL